MSEIGDIEAAILADGAVAIAGLTTALGDRNLDDIPADQFPFAYTVAQDQDVSALDFGQETRTQSISVVAAFRNRSSEQVKADLESWRTTLYADKTLGGLVTDLVAGIGLREMPEQPQKVGVLVVVTERTVTSAGDATASGPGAGIAEAVSVALATLTGGLRAGSDFTTLGGIPAGAIRFQVRADLIVRNERDSNLTSDVHEIEVAVHHRLANASNERAYTEGAKWTHQRSLASSPWWRALAGVLDVVEGPEVEPATRTGDVISYTAAVRLRMSP